MLLVASVRGNVVLPHDPVYSIFPDLLVIVLQIFRYISVAVYETALSPKLLDLR
jgi:hypothetical protein